jgi:hypothetical protein
MATVARRDRPRVLPGSLITLRRKCGKPGCRCATGSLHETPALSYSVNGKSKMLTLSPGEVPAVAAVVTRYRSAVDDLEAEARAEAGEWVIDGTEARAELADFVSKVRARRQGGRAGRVLCLSGPLRGGRRLPARPRGARARR